MEKCLILGGNGFIGKELTLSLLSLGFKVKVLSTRSWIDINPSFPKSTYENLEWVRGDFADSALVYEIVKEVTYVFHLISTTLPSSSNINPSFDVISNVSSTIKLLDACVANDVKGVIFASSGGTIYGIPRCLPISEDHPKQPISSYGIQKLIIEHYLYLYNHLYSLKSISLRISNPFGPGQDIKRGQGLITTFLIRIMSSTPIEIWGDGSVIRDYIYIDDVVSAFVASLDRLDSFYALNIGTGVGYSILNVVKAIERTINKTAEIKFKDSRKFDVPENVLNIKKALEILNWSPQLSLEDGIFKLVESLRYEGK